VTGQECVNILGLKGHGAFSLQRPGETDDAHAALGWAGCASSVICPTQATINMQAFLVSVGVVALAEIGDKTQLLALVLAARYRRPVPIILGILVATLLNHALAGAVGAWLSAAIGPVAMRWILGVSFIAMAIWTMIPDKYEEASERPPRFGIFGTTALAFFLLEMGDKTQIATVALAAKYPSLLAVVAGTTVGMMLANVPAVLLGEVAARKLPMRIVHGIAAAIFLVLGILVLLGVGR
jgi:putative Ca2+/H+ antiporter (TMEM165/GDT1 family)